MADDTFFSPDDAMEMEDAIEPQDAMTAMAASNLALSVPDDDLKAIGTTVVEEYDADIASRAGWESRMATALRLFSGDRNPKNWPWEGASNVHIPLLGLACLQFQARAYEALVPPKQTAKCIAMDGKAIDQAKRAETYLNYQLHYQMKEWEKEMDRALLVLPIYGSCYKKTYGDRKKKRPTSRLLDHKEFVTPYGCKDIDDAPRKMHVYPMTLNDIRIYAADGGFINIDTFTEGGQYESPAPQITEAADKMTGFTANNLPQDEPRTIIESHKLLDLNGDGIQEPYIVWVDKETANVLRIETRMYDNPVTRKQEVAEYFTAYSFIPNPESHYGIGLGHLMEGLNEAANSLINQIIDAGTIANLSSKTGFIAKRSGLKKGQVELELGKFVEVDFLLDDISKSIFQLRFSDASPTLFQLLGAITSYAKEIASISEGLLGKLPPSDTTATSMMAVMEQGLKVYSTIHKRLHRSLGEELEKLFYLNSLYLNEDEYFQVQDATSGAMLSFQSGRSDFMNNIDVRPSSDPNITSRAEKLMKAKELYQALAGNPLVMNNPFAMYEITKDLLESMDVPNIGRFKLQEAANFMLQQMMGGGGVGQAQGNGGVAQPAGGPVIRGIPGGQGAGPQGPGAQGPNMGQPG